jgi:hypothetical protein
VNKAALLFREATEKVKRKTTKKNPLKAVKLAGFVI